MSSISFLFPARRKFTCSRPAALGVALSALLARPALAGQSGVNVAAPPTSAIPLAQQGLSTAWQAQTITLTAAKQSLADVAATLSSRLGCAIVADGEPAREEADFDLHRSAKEALDTVADTFDCAWKIDKNGVVVFSRRFTSETDVPQMRLLEMTQMAGDFARLLPDTGLAPGQIIFPLNALYRTLTPEQLTSMQGKKHLDYLLLPPEQQKWVHLAIVNNLFGDSRSQWQRLHDMLAALPRARLMRQPCEITAIVERASLSPEATAKLKPSRYVARDANGHVREDLVVQSEPGEKLVCLWQDAAGQEQTLELFRQASTAADSLPSTNPSSTGASNTGTPDTSRSRAMPETGGKRQQEGSGTGERDARADDTGEPGKRGQPPAQRPVAATGGLNASVHLRLGSTTLEHVASLIEQQTGVHVLVPRELRDRQLVVQMDAVSALAALDALAELNEWRVTVYGANAVGLGRPNVPDVQQMRELTAALNGVLPADFRRFLGVRPVLPRSKPSSSAVRAEATGRRSTQAEAGQGQEANAQAPGSKPLTPLERERIAEMRASRADYAEEWNRQVATGNAEHKVYLAAARQEKRLWESLQAQGADTKVFTYRQLSAGQRERLAQIVTLEGLVQILAHSSRVHDILCGAFTPFQEDETKSFLTVEGAQILVSTETIENNSYYLQGFGEPIQPREKLPDPMRFGARSK